jgi:hypothetical protein
MRRREKANKPGGLQGGYKLTPLALGPIPTAMLDKPACIEGLDTQFPTTDDREPMPRSPGCS